ncbi:hypothetical protein BV898_09009 [Hypsibius exemplaris]|uniref:Uncharacterized protein n=1 Tax=Hypsibius exemplaris TaxID=2072580 RepID=A0A1W0WNV5_HYPEX|nr:hypothetical protein BV898_09009 [Hypsibius exemplaris]
MCYQRRRIVKATAISENDFLEKKMSLEMLINRSTPETFSFAFPRLLCHRIPTQFFSLFLTLPTGFPFNGCQWDHRPICREMPSGKGSTAATKGWLTRKASAAALDAEEEEEIPEMIPLRRNKPGRPPSTTATRGKKGDTQGIAEIAGAIRSRLRPRPATRQAGCVDSHSSSKESTPTVSQLKPKATMANASKGKVEKLTTGQSAAKRKAEAMEESSASSSTAKKRPTTSEVTRSSGKKDGDALIILSTYLQSIKIPTEEEALEMRAAKLNHDDAEFLRGKEALQALGLEIQENMAKLTAEMKAAKDKEVRKEIARSIDKVTVGSRALIQIGQKLAAQKDRLRIERELLISDQRIFAAKKLLHNSQPTKL